MVPIAGEADMRMRVVLDIDIDLDVWRTKYGERTSADLEVGEYVYRLVAFSDRLADCGADVRAK
ncbi:MAG TPA: hypothetical protein VGL93_24035 [Streptosporangiaceae bacterium]|jgi:hypothetical protein